MTVEISLHCALVFDKYRGFVEQEKILPQVSRIANTVDILHSVKLCNRQEKKKNKTRIKATCAIVLKAWREIRSES